jgi:hypothetical protein
VAGLVGFAVYEKFGAAQPLVPLVIFNNVTQSVTYAGTFLHGMILWTIVY